MKRTALLVILGMIAVSACGKKEPAGLEPAAVVRGVKVETLQPSKVIDEYEAVGTVRSRSSAVLSAKAIGAVVSVRVKEGDRVRAGQVLVEIDARDMQTVVTKAQAGGQEAKEALAEVDSGIRAAEQAVHAAQANRDFAAATYRRFKMLSERNSVSRQEFDEVEARHVAAEAEAARAADMREAMVAKRRQVLAKMDQAKADLAGAQVAVSFSRVTAPFSGVVVAKSAEVGTLAAPGVPLLTVEDDAHYRLEAAVEESRIRGIRVGAPVQVRVDALGAEDIAGRIEEISPAADPSSRSYTAKIGLGGQRGLRSGLFGRALFPGDERHVLLVPKKAIVERGQLKSVLAVDGANVVHLRLITTGREEGDRVEVLSGLNAGERIVAEGAERIADGSRVE